MILWNFGCIERIRRVREDFTTTYEEFIGSIFQPSEIASYIRALIEQNAIARDNLGVKKVLALEISLEMARYVVCPQKK